MKIRTTLFVLIVLLLVMNVLPVLPAVVEAASITCVADRIEAHYVQVSGKVTYSSGTFNHVYLNLYDYNHQFIKQVQVNENPYKYTFSTLDANKIYYISAGYSIINPTQIVHPQTITVKTLTEPTVSASDFVTGSSSVKFNVKVTANNHILKKIGYRLYLVKDNSLVADQVVLTNVSTNVTNTITIEGLSSFTSYKMNVYLETQLGWRKFVGPYEFKTKLAAITAYPRPSSTPSPKPTPTPTPSPSPTPDQTAAPTSTPKPTSAATTSQATTTETTTVETTQPAANTPTPEPTTTPATTSQPVETTLPAETTTLSSSSQTQETTPDPTQPQGNDNNNDFPWSVLIIALVALAGIGFGVGGALMIVARKKK